MPLNPPPTQHPITDKITNSIWIRWFDNIRNVIRGCYGWYDYNDLTTQTTPQAITASTKTYLTNDGGGQYTTKTYKLYGVDDLYNTSTNAFDFSNLSIGDTIGIRIDLIAETTSPNQDIEIGITFGIGSASEYSLNLTNKQTYKTATTHDVVFYNKIYIGSDDIKNNPAKIFMISDHNVNVKMNGYFIEARKYII